MVVEFNPVQYHQRNIVETVFAVLKRKFGESLKARKFRLQVKEIKIKVILYNLSRLMTSFIALIHIVIKVFYKAANSYKYFKREPDLVSSVKKSLGR